METLPKGSVIYRIHALDKGVIWFGPAPGSPPRYRFDDPVSRYGVLYAAAEEVGAFVETFLRDLTTRIVARSNLALRRITPLETTRPLALVSAYGPGLVHLGTTGAIAAAVSPGINPWEQYSHSQTWSRALFVHPEKPDGILYRSSHDDSLLCYAIFDRATNPLRESAPPTVLSNRIDIIADAVKRYGVGVS